MNQQNQIRVQLSVTIVAILSQQLLPRASGKGRVAAFELLVSTPAIRNLIREQKTYRIDSSIQTGRKWGMVLLDDYLFELWQRGIVKAEEALLKARKPVELQQKIEQAAGAAAAARKTAAGKKTVEDLKMQPGARVR